MNHATPLDELAHYVGQLRIDVLLGVERRHLLATARLCGVLIERIEKDGPPKMSLVEFKALEIQLLDLQRAIAGNPTAQPQAKPLAKVIRLRPVDCEGEA